VNESPSQPDPAQPEASAPQPEPEATRAERRTSPVELLWDLVYVFAITQVTTLLAHHPSWGRFGQAMLALALVWWAWAAFVWAANAQEQDSQTLRATLLVGMVLVFIFGLALPQAFGREGLLFAGSYVLVRLLHLALYVDASRRGNAAFSAIAGFAVTVLIGMAILLVGAAFLHGTARALAWLAAAAIDYSGPAWLTRERLRGLQEVAVAHFAERFGSFVIIALGESVLDLGVGVSQERHLSAAILLATSLALLIAVGMWWTYFDRSADRAMSRLRAHPEPVLVAADAYSYIHLIIVGGIIVFAGGVKLVVHIPVSAPIPDAGRLAQCGGVALYLVGLAAFRLRISGRIAYGRPLAAVSVLILYAVSGSWSAWLIPAAIAIVMGVLCWAEVVGGPRGLPADRAPQLDATS
jgi:low temperature requirement protein LtrA